MPALCISGGDGRDLTADLLIANQSLSHLSYAPRKCHFTDEALCLVGVRCGAGFPAPWLAARHALLHPHGRAAPAPLTSGFIAQLITAKALCKSRPSPIFEPAVCLIRTPISVTRALGFPLERRPVCCAAAG